MIIEDEQIKKDIVNQLYSDDRVDVSDIKVEVANGNVTLTGTIPTYSVRRGAETDVWTVPGVTFVDNRLLVKRPADMKLPEDEEIKGNIENLLSWNPGIDASNIQVSVYSGSVTLDGSVDAFWKKVLAESMADVDGVSGITKRLSVAPSKSIRDQAIADHIVSTINCLAGVDIDSVNVKVNKGVVTLSGYVNNWMTLRTIQDVALYKAGVTNVDTKGLSISPS